LFQFSLEVIRPLARIPFHPISQGNHAKERIMSFDFSFDFEYVPQSSLNSLIKQASAETGFTPVDIAAMINSELEIDHLLDYITAVVSKRMN
jgi:hypothetical protein